jgi:hypothetical protein
MLRHFSRFALFGKLYTLFWTSSIHSFRPTLYILFDQLYTFFWTSSIHFFGQALHTLFDQLYTFFRTNSSHSFRQTQDTPCDKHYTLIHATRPWTSSTLSFRQALHSPLEILHSFRKAQHTLFNKLKTLMLTDSTRSFDKLYTVIHAHGIWTSSTHSLRQTEKRSFMLQVPRQALHALLTTLHALLTTLHTLFGKLYTLLCVHYSFRQAQHIHFDKTTHSLVPIRPQSFQHTYTRSRQTRYPLFNQSINQRSFGQAGNHSFTNPTLIRQTQDILSNTPHSFDKLNTVFPTKPHTHSTRQTHHAPFD